MSHLPHDEPYLIACLDELLEVEFSRRDTRIPARLLAPLSRREQEHTLEWARRVASIHVELGFQYAINAPRALVELAPEQLEEWACHAMDCYDREGLRPALAVLKDLDGYLRGARERAHGARLGDHEGVLLGFLRGLSGRRLAIAPCDALYTDGETLFLPPVIAELPEPADNFLLYKAAVAQLWGQTRFGALRHDLVTELAGLASTTPTDAEAILALFHACESLRLEGVLARELPGLARRVQALAQPALPEAWLPLRPQLQRPETRARDALELARRLAGRLAPFPPPVHHGVLRLDRILAAQEVRMERERLRLKVILRDLDPTQGRIDKAPDPEPDPDLDRPRFQARKEVDEATGEVQRAEILLDDQPVPLPEEARALVSSILLDWGDIPPEFLEAAGPGDYDPGPSDQKEIDPESVWSGRYHEEGAALYPEWDYQRQQYRKEWCAMREREVAPVYDGFVAETLARHGGLIKHLRKTFEALRDENRTLRRQTWGDGIDLDALTEALADIRDGREMTDRLFTRLHRTERNIAVAFMVDMSGSTKGWINDAEREALILLCESLQTLGDRYAIYGFSSVTRKRCELFRIKRFDEPYGAEVQARISGIRPQEYTRMGFAIRHLSHILKGQEARTRLLITLSDGKPDDYDGYRGQYGIEDTRRALIEARRDGIHPYCITIDDKAGDYLPHLYGPAAYTVVDDVSLLPAKVSNIYRRLTT